MVIPAYNAAAFLGDAIRSVLAQTFEHYEIIVVDDGSTDATPEVAARFERSIRYIRQENAGPARARNRGIQEARGEFIAFLDSDDLWLPTKLERQLALFRERPELGLVTTGVEALTGEGPVLDLEGKRRRLFADGNVARSILEGSGMATPSVMVPRRVLDEAGGFCEELRIAEDDHLWMRIAANHPSAMVDEVLVRTRVRADSLTSDVELLFRDVRRSLEHLRDCYPEVYEQIEEAVPAKLAGIHFAVGYHRFGEGDIAGARRAFLGSVKHRPGRTLPWLYTLVCLLPAPLVRWLKEKNWPRRLKRWLTRENTTRQPGAWPPKAS